MVFLGIILAGAAVSVAVAIIADNSGTASLSVFGQHVPGVTSEAQVFVAGLIVAIFFVIGLAIASLAMGRSVRVRRELRNLREEHEESMATMEMERQQLQRELARARSTTGGTPTTSDIPVAGRKQRDRDPISPFFDQSA
jgi:HAMP domain-containing protein